MNFSTLYIIKVNINSFDIGGFVMEASIDNLVTIFNKNSNKRICILGTTCTGKTTLINQILV